MLYQATCLFLFFCCFFSPLGMQRPYRTLTGYPHETHHASSLPPFLIDDKPSTIHPPIARFLILVPAQVRVQVWLSTFDFMPEYDGMSVLYVPFL